jgi:hypothetical protein
MMGAQASAMAPPFKPRRWSAAATAAISALLLSGCNLMERLPDVLYLAIATNPDQTIDGELLTTYRQRPRPCY